jgi:hypothetical protein
LGEKKVFYLNKELDLYDEVNDFEKLDQCFKLFIDKF